VKLLQKDVAGILGVDTTTVNNWERKRCGPRLYLIPEIVKFLKYNPFPTVGNPSITEAIKPYRQTHGLSQKKLAKFLGIDPTTLARWENGRSKPSQRSGGGLAELMGSCADATQEEAPTAHEFV